MTSFKVTFWSCCCCFHLNRQIHPLVEEDIPSLSCCCGHNANLLLQKLQKEIRWMKDTLSWWRVPRLYLGAHEPTNEGTERATKLLLHSTSMIMKKIVQNCNFSRCGPLAFSFHEGKFLLCLYEEKMWLCSVHLFPKGNEKRGRKNLEYFWATERTWHRSGLEYFEAPMVITGP